MSVTPSLYDPSFFAIEMASARQVANAEKSKFWDPGGESWRPAVAPPATGSTTLMLLPPTHLGHNGQPQRAIEELCHRLRVLHKPCSVLQSGQYVTVRACHVCHCSRLQQALRDAINNSLAQQIPVSVKQLPMHAGT